MHSPALTLYFDGRCAFCSTEMARLRRWDRKHQLAFVDITDPGFDPAHLGATIDQLNLDMYSQAADGTVYAGIDSLLAAYTATGRGYLVAPLRVPFLRPPLAWLYRLFARHRYRMSRLLGYQRTPLCDEGVCAHRNPYLKD
jgi:predicted DCC family thiol-disulfide oxidoreductase YuxK